MPVTVLLPTALRSFVDYQSEVEVEGRTVGEVIHELSVRYPDISNHLYTEEGTLREFINVYVEKDNIKNLEGLDTKVEDETTIMLVPAIAGGKIETKSS